MAAFFIVVLSERATSPNPLRAPAQSVRTRGNVRMLLWVWGSIPAALQMLY